MSQRRRANLLLTPVNETPLSLRWVHRLRRFKTEPRVFPPSPPLIVEQQERLWALFFLSRRAFVMIIPNPNRLLIYSADNWMFDNRSCPLCPLVKTRVSSKWCVGISPSSFRASAGLYSHCDPRPLSPVPAAIHAAFRRDLTADEALCEKTAGSQS